MRLQSQSSSVAMVERLPGFSGWGRRRQRTQPGVSRQFSPYLPSPSKYSPPRSGRPRASRHVCASVPRPTGTRRSACQDCSHRYRCCRSSSTTRMRHMDILLRGIGRGGASGPRSRSGEQPSDRVAVLPCESVRYRISDANRPICLPSTVYRLRFTTSPRRTGREPRDLPRSMQAASCSLDRC